MHKKQLLPRAETALYPYNTPRGMRTKNNSFHPSIFPTLMDLNGPQKVNFNAENCLGNTLCDPADKLTGRLPFGFPDVGGVTGVEEADDVLL